MSSDDTGGRSVTITIDGERVEVAEGATLLDACRAAGFAIPTLCQADTLTPRNACRVCVVELEGGRALAPACSRRAEDGMVVATETERVRLSRRMVLEFLASSADLSTTPDVADWNERYGVDSRRYGPPRAAADHDGVPGHHAPTSGTHAETVWQVPKLDNDLYVRDYAKCILCYKCVDACGSQWQNSFAITVAGRGFAARISTEFDAALPDSACVFCGNCVAVCPTGALMAKPEYDLRRDGTWDEERQARTDTVCPYCGVGCNLTLHVQDNRIVKVTSPSDHSVAHGNLCIKGRFGFDHVQDEPDRSA